MSLAPFPVDPGLSAIAIAYRNEELIADQVAPRVPTKGELFKYMKFNLAEGFTVPDTKVGRKGQPTEVEFSATEEADKTEDQGLDDVIPIKDIDNAAPGFDLLGHATMSLTDLVQLGREVRVASKVFNAATYAAGQTVTLAGTDQWSDFENSDPISDILTGLDSCIMRPNIGIFGRPTWTVLRQHPKIVKATNRNSGDAGAAARQAVAELLELDDVIVGSGWVNAAKKGQVFTKQRVWGKHAAFLRRDPLATLDNGRPTFMLTAQWGGRFAGQIPEQRVGLAGAVRVRSGERVKEVAVCSDLGYFIQNAVA